MIELIVFAILWAGWVLLGLFINAAFLVLVATAVMWVIDRIKERRK
jgi:hypothetical protein